MKVLFLILICCGFLFSQTTQQDSAKLALDTISAKGMSYADSLNIKFRAIDKKLIVMQQQRALVHKYPSGSGFVLYKRLQAQKDSILDLKRFYDSSVLPYNGGLFRAGQRLERSAKFMFWGSCICAIGSVVTVFDYKAGLPISAIGIIINLYVPYQIYKAGKDLRTTTGIGKPE
jgi:hypothetical protein